MAKFRKPLFFALALVPIAVVAGIFTGIYQLDALGEDLIAEAVAQLGSKELLLVLTAVQTVGYALVCGFFGCLLAEKLGLWKPLLPTRQALAVTLLVSVAGGVVFSLDYWVFGSVLDGIQEGTLAGMTVSGVLASVLYGGVIEEVMMRLFFMSLLAWLIWKVFFRKHDREHIPAGVFVAANVAAALLFAAGHLPAIIMTFGELNGLLLLRCFLLNGGFGLIFGWLYRKYGIGCAMLSHGLFHIVSKLIWLLFA